MRALVQVVERGCVEVDHQVIAETGYGLCVYIGVESEDTPEVARRVADRIAQVRLLPSEKGPFDQSVLDTRGDILVISNFTLMGKLDSGRRPSWSAAMGPKDASIVLNAVVEKLRAEGINVLTGAFGAEMVITTSNHGPTNLLIEECAK